MLDPSANVGPKGRGNVDSAAEEATELLLQGDEVQQGSARLEIDEEVEVAGLVRSVASDGAEDADVTRPMPTSHRQEVGPLRLKVAEHQSHAATVPPAAADRRTLGARVSFAAPRSVRCPATRSVGPAHRSWVSPDLVPHSGTSLVGVGLIAPAMRSDQHPIQVSPEALERVAALRLSGLPLSTLLALLAKLDSSGRAAITQPELGKLLSTGPGKVWQSLRVLVDAGVIEPPTRRGGFGSRAPYRIPADLAVAPSVPPRQVKTRRAQAPLTPLGEGE